MDHKGSDNKYPLYYIECVYSHMSHDCHNAECGISVLIQVGKVWCLAGSYCSR
jgi:hypothetical protein